MFAESRPPHDAGLVDEQASEPVTVSGAPEENPPASSEEAPSKEAARTDRPPMDLARDPAQETADETAPLAQPEPEPASQNARRPEDITLTVATWNSAYTAAQQRALFAPFTEETGHSLETVSHGDLMRLSAEMVTAEGWDLVELDAQTARRGCDEGWLARIDAADLPASVEGDPAAADYLPGALMSCAVGSAAWSAVVVHDPRAAFEEAPQRITDLFALERFPGKRALPRQAPYVLELALLADGVPPSEIYDVLATPAGQDRAFARLSAVRHAIVWWDEASKALEPFASAGPDDIDDVVMGVAFNGRVFTSAVRARQWLRILWDGQIYRFNYWATPTSAPNAEAARRLLRFVSLPERQARLTRWFPYGPVRKSALPLVGQHAEIDLDMADFVPTMPRNMAGALRFDQAFWDEHGEALKARFAEWLKLPTPQVPADQFVPPTPVKALRANILTVQ
ncbi:extracellular solute-binding protein [Dichotomicrobium thermohalophilum]|nr:extracellular solute-binding protein [Dichotomicrobium thermohalophilum]